MMIVPNYVSEAINAAIDEKLAGRPCDDAERQDIFNRLLAYFNDHVAIPDFTLTAK